MNAILQKNRLSFADFCRKFITSESKGHRCPANSYAGFLFYNQSENNIPDYPRIVRSWALPLSVDNSRVIFLSSESKEVQPMHNLTHLLNSINLLSRDDVAAFMAFVKAYKRSGASEILHVSHIQSGQTLIFFCLAKSGDLGETSQKQTEVF